MRALGHLPLVAPLLTVVPLGFDAEALNGAGALAFTSVNGARACALPSVSRRTPVFAVGAATADAARAAGFLQVRSADGDVAALAALLIEARPPQPVVLAGASAPAGDLVGVLTAAGLRATRIAVYAAEDAEVLPAAAVEADVVLLHSPRAARTLAALADPRLRQTATLCLSDAVAEPLRRSGFLLVSVAVEPTDKALLALLPPLGARSRTD